MSHFKAGDKVYSLLHGHGVVDEILDNTEYSVRCYFEDDCIHYDQNGFYFNTHHQPTLFKSGSTLIFQLPDEEVEVEKEVVYYVVEQCKKISAFYDKGVANSIAKSIGLNPPIKVVGTQKVKEVIKGETITLKV